MLELFLFNFLISSFFYIYNKKRKRRDALLWLIIIITVPIVGAVMYIAFGSYKRFTSDINLDYGNMQQEKDSSFYSYVLTKPDLTKELNIIPIEDALILNDNITKRKLMIDALKGDTYQYIGFLKKALKDPDTETSHYAATAVTEIKRKLMLSVQQLEIIYETSNNDLNYLIDYRNVLEKYINSGLLDEKSLKKYGNIYVKVLEKILHIDKKNEQNYEKKINCDVKLKKYEEAINVCNEYMSNFPLSDKPYILLMKIYFEQMKRKEFDIVMERLRNSEVKLQYDSLQIIRFWLEGV